MKRCQNAKTSGAFRFVSLEVCLQTSVDFMSGVVLDSTPLHVNGIDGNGPISSPVKFLPSDDHRSSELD
jgi:hypothetical protein